MSISFGSNGNATAIGGIALVAGSPSDGNVLQYSASGNEWIFGTGGGATPTVSAIQNIGTLTWTGTSAPSGTIVQKYQWTQTGKAVTAEFVITATTPGLASTSVTFALPGDMPIPASLTGLTTNILLVKGDGMLTTANTSVTLTGGSSISFDGSGNAKVTISDVAAAAVFVLGTISYIAA